MAVNIFDLSLATVAVAFCCILFWKRQNAGHHLPPGPSPDFLIGHARKLPLTLPWITYSKWKHEYGDVIYTYALGRSIVILNSFVAARDLLEKKSATFSDRPYLPVFNMMGWELILPFLRYGPRFRKHRRIVHQHFGPTSIANFRPIQERETRKFLNRLLTNPDMFLNHIHNLIAGINLSVTYGHEVQSDNDAYIELVENAVHLSTSLGSLGTSVIDIFPFLRYLPASLPGMRLKRLTEKTRKVVESVMTAPLEDVKSKRFAGAAPQCVISDLLDKYDDMGVIDHQHEEDIMNIGASVYNAGTDTTKSTLTAFFFMMTLHPEVSKSAQEEIDRVVGNHRLPSFDDRKDLPYVECLLKELYRIHPPVPIGIPHGSTETEEYRGWTIPKGTIAIANICAFRQMMREETVFQNPDKFTPERFLDKAKASLGPPSPSKLLDGSHALSGEEDPSVMVFGFGRRVCPGKYLADSNLWLAIANVLAMFDIEPYTNPETGKVELPKNEIEEDKVVLVLKPFKCKISPRNGRTSTVL